MLLIKILHFCLFLLKILTPDEIVFFGETFAGHACLSVRCMRRRTTLRFGLFCGFLCVSGRANYSEVSRLSWIPLRALVAEGEGERERERER